MAKPRVLIQVYGGVADYICDEGVDVELIDYDNEPDAEIPERFRDLQDNSFYDPE